MTTTAKPILFLTFANDRDDRARDLRALAAEARQVLAATEQPGGGYLQDHVVTRVAQYGAPGVAGR